ncbi:MAG: hypothetical protein H6779_01455 [Candidatus Nomurabacteria bacterium]|nr:MAG: hypothetical protein H6779_01455 [Candidatus Nomurabacteria bacterium]
MQPVVKPLSYRHRNFVFITLTLVFLISLPIFIFYSAGYRYDFFSETPTVTATGGLYIASEASDSQIYIDEVEVANVRIFRKASYLQGIQPGVHRVHVQAPGLHTWVKNLLVSPQIVTEAESFNLPVIPQVRPVTEYTDKTGEAIYFVKTAPTDLFSDSSSTLPVIFATSSATSSYDLNPEYALLDEIFVEKASTTAALAAWEKVQATKFGFATATPVIVDGEVATTTVTRDHLQLYKDGDDVFVHALGTGKQVPYYFCSDPVVSTSSAAVEAEITVDPEEEIGIINRVEPIAESSCRTDIRIDRKWQIVHDFNFLPGNLDLVLMHLDDGIYVVEADDRSWQNVQLLYPGENLQMLIYGEQIFVKNGKFIFEALTTIDSIKN